MFYIIQKFIASIPKYLGVDKYRLGAASWQNREVKLFGNGPKRIHRYFCANVLFDGIAMTIALTPAMYTSAYNRCNKYGLTRWCEYTSGVIKDHQYKCRMNNNVRKINTWLIQLRQVETADLLDVCLALNMSELAEAVAIGTSLTSEGLMVPTKWERFKLWLCGWVD